MNIVVTTVIIIFVGVLVAFIFIARRGTDEKGERSGTADPAVPRRPMPIVTEFHVTGDTARTVFAVPLGDAEAGPHLIGLLSGAAVEYLREKSANGLPLDDVKRIEISAMRGDASELLATVDLPDPGVLPDPADSVMSEPTHDPIAAVHSVIADASVAPQSDSSVSLNPVAQEVKLSGPTDSHLRSIGVDPESMDLDDLVLGLLRISGYDIHVGRKGISGLVGVRDGKADVYAITRDGKSALLMILNHHEGSHPELEDSVLAKFAVEIAQANPSQAILVTDKYSPYSMYERERRDKRCVYITRERLQAFVDSFGLS